MADRSDLPPSLRRAAKRPAAPGRQPSDRVVAAVETGLLSRRNTTPGTVGRQAVDRVTYVRRKAKRPDISAREALGHERPEVRARRVISVLLDRPDPFVLIEAPSRGEASRAGRYNSFVGKLAAFRMTPKQFERQVSSWRPIRGERFLADPDRVLAWVEARRASGQELFVYEPGRAR